MTRHATPAYASRFGAGATVDMFAEAMRSINDALSYVDENSGQRYAQVKFIIASNSDATKRQLLRYQSV